MPRIVGVLEAFSETGSEGIHWAIIDNDKTGPESLVILHDGDYLFIDDGNKGIEWEGYIQLRRDTHREPFLFLDKEYSRQRVNNCTVHGLQDNIEPNVWFEWFVSNRPAVLIRHGEV